MGYTSFTKQLIEPYLKGVKSVLDFGSCNDFSTGDVPPPFISKWYEDKGKDYTSIDLAGDNNSLKLNWCYPLPESLGQFDIVVDAGSSEHSAIAKAYTNVRYNENVNSIYPSGDIDAERGYYECWLNKHNLCKVWGLIISENPESKSWHGHGYSYITENFYTQLAKIAAYEILVLGRHPAMGNDKDGWNIFSVIRKHSESFPSFDDFSKLPIYKS
jgi:hypothetical protein